MAGAPELRVSDAERELAVDQLRKAAGQGRLDPDELDDRVSRALSARTRADLDALLGDLPAPAPAGAVEPRPERQMELRRRTAQFLTPVLAAIVIWAATGAGSFWPLWVIVVCGLGYGGYLIRHLLGVEERERRH